MKIVVLGSESILGELFSNGPSTGVEKIHVNTVEEVLQYPDADAFFDMNFDNSASRKALLNKISKPVFVNSVIHTLSASHTSFIRLNGWSTFLKRSIMEASCTDELMKRAAGEISDALNKTIDWVPDVSGFVSARVVSMIVNEAYFALEEKVSNKAEIDIAMKLGTNYPYGPFEWSEKIGLKNIYDLLVELKKTNSRYQPAALLEKEATL